MFSLRQSVRVAAVSDGDFDGRLTFFDQAMAVLPHCQSVANIFGAIAAANGSFNDDKLLTPHVGQ